MALVLVLHFHLSSFVFSPYVVVTLYAKKLGGLGQNFRLAPLTMSWKGLTKAVSRLPHQILSKKSETTRDEEFIALEKKFNEQIKIVEKLQKDGQTFRDAVSALLMHQTSMSAFMATIYSSNLGVEVEEGGVQRRFQQTPAAALQAVNDAEAAMDYCRAEILPELDAVDRYVIGPTMQMMEIMKIIQKTMTKRNHKLIDYDRHRTGLNKLKAKEQRSFNEEKQILKLEAQLETATQDYQYLNDMLKQQLPQFFYLKTQFIRPVFEQFYYLQCKIYGMIYARCHELINANNQHFVTQSMGVEEGYQWRKSQRDGRAELENLDLLKAGGKTWIAASGGSTTSKLSLKERAALKQQEAGGSYSSPSSPDMGNSSTSPPPAYGSPAGGVTLEATPISMGKTPAWTQQQQQQQQQRAPPPPPPPSSKPSRVQYVVALYDYDAQAEGDLSFRKGDRIEVLERTADVNDWWTGRLHGVSGIFPGNYVSEV
ncbi:hypothetical protein EC973_007212 [Apophysomyces ossiformis]|uniref:BAR-domain-containing protein n=1 Tax=Apophysomyces ossiformis TaxID=679940 RepID=A0A8H7BQ55_9FUNG|nr:hypothetical protein EC973_007212 [Apophysomyces ossiformis]